MELYMGMLGHAAFVRADRRVFAPGHPSGSVPMAARVLIEPEDPRAGLPAEVSFPYGFPRPGSHRICVQVKRAGEIPAGACDAKVEN
jgi:hypothetical protein